MREAVTKQAEPQMASCSLPGCCYNREQNLSSGAEKDPSPRRWAPSAQPPTFAPTLAHEALTWFCPWAANKFGLNSRQAEWKSASLALLELWHRHLENCLHFLSPQPHIIASAQLASIKFLCAWILPSNVVMSMSFYSLVQQRWNVNRLD